MPLDTLPGQLQTPTRDQLRDKWLRDYKLRFSLAGTTPPDTGPNSSAFIRASTYADAEIGQYANALTIAANVAISTSTGASLDQKATDAGTVRFAPVGASGAVAISASSGGVNLTAGQEIKINGLRYQAMQSGIFLDQSQISVAGVDTGPQTNVAAGSVMTWTNPPPGLGPLATVVTQADGSGLSNGHAQESDGELQRRLIALKASQIAAGNDADIQAAIFKTPGLSIQQAFTYPAIKGGTTTGFCFTLRPSGAGASRIPNAAQISAVLAYLTGRFSASFVFLGCSLVASPVNIALKLLWASGTPGWTDAVPWPLYVSPMAKVNPASASPTATTFNIIGAATAPQAGNTIAFFDLPNLRFRRKRVLTATLNGGTGGYDIVCDTSNGISDTSYTPLASQVCCPWSDSLDSLTAPILTYTDVIGPGEQLSNFFDPGLRQKRSPAPTLLYPNTITNRILAPVFSLSSVGDVVLQEPTVPYATPVGTPGVSSNLLTVGTLVAFPE